MAVYKRENSPFYYFEFQHHGRRFFGSTKQTEKRRAEQVEAAERKKAEALSASLSKPMTVKEACARYWIEIGQHAATADDIFAYLGRIEKEFGGTTMLTTLTTNRIALAVGSRRTHTVKRGDQATPVSNATVNRTLTEPLRRVMRRATKVWEQQLKEVAWTELLLPEAGERIREATDHEEANILAAIRPDFRPAIEFAIATGCRLEEVVGLVWERVYWTAGTMEIRGKGRRGAEEQIRIIPITAKIRRILWPLKDHHKTAVFTYVAVRPDKQAQIARGERVPITYEGLKTQWRRSKRSSGVNDFRFHDTRHTALTRLVRETGNLKLAQQLAGHSDIATTAKYAHANVEDLRRGMEATDAAKRTKSHQNPITQRRGVGQDDDS